MRLRQPTAADFAQLERFDLGDTTSSVWLAEVAEIVSDLLGWRDAYPELDRQVLLLEADDAAVVAVAAHEAEEYDNGGILLDRRYLMVPAVRADARRGGLARLLVTSVIADMQTAGARTVSWLVHPNNAASLAFSHNTSSEADEREPPEDKPYVRFTLYLA